jgi:hypothetical protein
MHATLYSIRTAIADLKFQISNAVQKTGEKLSALPVQSTGTQEPRKAATTKADAGLKDPALRLNLREPVYPQSAVKSTRGNATGRSRYYECNLTEFWILIYCLEVGGALIRGVVY